MSVFVLFAFVLQALDVLCTATTQLYIQHADGAVTQELVRSGFADRTILTIAHRLNTIIDNDRILLMDFGRVAECGPNCIYHCSATHANVTSSVQP